MRLTVLGCGDAFGAGGRLQTSFHLDGGGGASTLVDCGATSMIGMTRAGLDPGRVATILVSHLHGDHFGGLPWWLIHAVFVARRTAPLTIAGPEGTEARFRAASEVLYPGSTTAPRNFDLRFVAFHGGAAGRIGEVMVTPFVVDHPSGAPSYALRIESEGRRIGFSGDAAWGDGVIEAARGADLFITECTSYRTPVPYHVSWAEIEADLARIEARRIMLSHMGPAMLAKSGAIAAASGGRIIAAEDGLVVDL